jgi:putative nucleotidyltransferase with HDIG domain
VSTAAAGAFLDVLAGCVARRGRRAPSGSVPIDGASLVRAAAALTAGRDVVFTVGPDGLRLDGTLLPGDDHADVTAALRRSGIASMTIRPGADAEDLAGLVARIAGVGGDRLSARRIRLEAAAGESTPRPAGADLEAAYAAAVDVLRQFAAGAALDYARAAGVVGDLVRGSREHPRTALALAATRDRREIVIHHSVNVCLLALALGEAVGLDDSGLRLLGIGALLHDVGRIPQADRIVHKRERLTDADWDVIRSHPQDGAATILEVCRRGDEVAARVALEHHLRPDGGGYPDLPGLTPHLFARITSIADTYDAITNDRPYRPGRRPSEAVRLLAAGAGEAYDPDLVRAFTYLLGAHPPGSLLRLGDGRLVLVVPADPGELRGVVVRPDGGRLLVDGEAEMLDPALVGAELAAGDAGVTPDRLIEALLGAASAPVP